MNERIGKLAVKAGAHWEHFGDWNMPSAVYFSERDLEKFAQLILQDVLDICEEMGDKGMDGHYCVDKIRREFGV